MIPQAVLDALPWVLPPLLGAVIGWVTNALAIKMLFRPLTEKKVLGIKIPFTPGIIPRQRYALAESIGNMVSEKLLGEETVTEYLETDYFRNNIYNNIDSFYDSVTDTPLSEVSAKWDMGEIRKSLHNILHQIITSEAFLQGISSLVEYAVKSLSEKKLNEILEHLKLEKNIDSFLTYITNDQSKQAFMEVVEKWLDSHLEGNTKIGSFMPERTGLLLRDFLYTLYPYVSTAIFNWLRHEDIQKGLEDKGRILLKDILSKLNIFQRFFISAGQYDKTLEEKMPEIIESITNQLEDMTKKEETRETFIRNSVQGLEKWTSQGVADIDSAGNLQLKSKIMTFIAQLFMKASEPAIKEKIRFFIAKRTEGYTNLSIGELIERYLNIKPETISKNLAGSIKQVILEKSSAETVTNLIINLVNSFFETNENMNLKEILLLKDNTKDMVSTFLTDQVIILIKSKIPGILKSINIKKLVVDRVNSLDVADVERLLLMVIEKHLRWINLFGAILGALIGFSQLFLRFIT